MIFVCVFVSHMTDLIPSETRLIPSVYAAFCGSGAAFLELVSHIFRCPVHSAARLEDTSGLNSWTPSVSERCVRRKPTPIRAVSARIPWAI